MKSVVGQASHISLPAPHEMEHEWGAFEIEFVRNRRPQLIEWNRALVNDPVGADQRLHPQLAISYRQAVGCAQLIAPIIARVSAGSNLR